MRNLFMSVSAAALVMAAAPTFAGETKVQNQASMSSTSDQAAASTRTGMDAGEMKDKLDGASIEDREEVKGHVVRAQSPEGQPILFVVGPEDMKAGESSDDFNEDKVRGELTTAGFQDIEFVADAEMLRGKMGDDKHVLVVTGGPGWRGIHGVAEGDKPDLDRLGDFVGEAGVDDAAEFNGEFLRARTDAGETAFVLIGAEGFGSDDSTDLSAEELNDLQQQGFESVEMADDLVILRGEMEGGSVLILGGESVTQ